VCQVTTDHCGQHVRFLFSFQTFDRCEVNGLYICRLDSANVASGLGVPVMPIYEILRRQGVFAPDEVTMIGNVFEDVLRTLGLVKRTDPMTEMVAKKLVELATAGMRDPDRLKVITIQTFTQQQQQQQQIQRKPARRVPWPLNKLLELRRTRH
jgi:hypothetical protein